MVQNFSLSPLSEDARKARMPLKPEDLVGALHDPVHRDVGRARTVKATRVKKADASLKNKV